MTQQNRTSRRAILAGAASLPALSITATATPANDQQWIELGRALREQLNLDYALGARYRLARAAGMDKRAAYDDWNATQAKSHQMADAIMAINEVTSPAVVGVMAMAAFFLEWTPGLDESPPVAALVKEAARVGGIQLPDAMLAGIEKILAEGAA